MYRNRIVRKILIFLIKIKLLIQGLLFALFNADIATFIRSITSKKALIIYFGKFLIRHFTKIDARSELMFNT